MNGELVSRWKQLQLRAADYDQQLFSKSQIFCYYNNYIFSFNIYIAQGRNLCVQGTVKPNTGKCQLCGYLI